MGTIQIQELEVHYRVGVPDEERAQPQRLLINLDLEVDFRECAATDDVLDTINYFDVCQLIRRFGDGRSWKTLEKLACDLTAAVLAGFNPDAVTVEIRKFIIPETRYVSVKLTQTAQSGRPARR